MVLRTKLGRLRPNAIGGNDGQKTARNKESSEVVWGPFVSASSSRMTLA
jgi:hypothetical protein